MKNKIIRILREAADRIDQDSDLAPVEELKPKEKVKIEHKVPLDKIELPNVPLEPYYSEDAGGSYSKEKVNMYYPLIPKRPRKGEPIFAYAHIRWNPPTHSFVYNVVEPYISPENVKLMETIKTTLQEKLDVDFNKITSKEAEDYLNQKIDEVMSFLQIQATPGEKRIIMYFIKRDFIGSGAIEPMMRDPYIEDISCLPSFEKVLVKKSGKLQLIEIGKLIDDEIGSGDDTRIAKPEEVEVLSFDPSNFKTCFKPTEVFVRRKNKEGHYIRIRTEGGNFINTSPDHPVLVLTDSGVITKLAKDVREDDYLISLKSTSIEGEDIELDLIDTFANSDIDVRVRGAKDLLKGNKSLSEKLGVKWYDISNWKQSDSMPLWVYMQLEDSHERRKALQISGGQGVKNWMPAMIKLDENFAEFTGLFLAEGHLGKSDIQLSFGKHEKSLCEGVAEMARRMFNCTSNVVEKETALVVYCGGKLLKALFENILGCGRDSYTKRVPDVFYKTAESVRKALVKGVWLGDGYVRCDDRVNKAVLATASPELAWGMRFLLKTLGISTHLHARNRKFANTWEVSVEHGSSLQWIAALLKKPMNGSAAGTQLSSRYPNFLFDTEDYHGVDRRLVRNALRTDKRLGLKLALKSKNQMIHSLLNGDVHPVKVIGMESVEYSGPFYDFKVKDYSNFMHGDFIFTHNCDGVGIPIFIYHRNPMIGSIPSNVIFKDGDSLDTFVQKLAQRSGKSISVAEPLIDASLPDGSRLQATLSTDIARRGSNFTIRKFTESPLTPTDVVNFGTTDSRVLAYLWFCIENGKSILVSGGTATGKTTMLNVLSMFIRPEAKIVSIEDTAELKLNHPHWIPEVAREAISTEGEKSYGSVDLFDLLKSSLRQRPDYIVVGEVRGKEAYVLFQQIATGHTGLSTIHAENMEKLIDRLTTEPINLSPSLLETLDIVAFLKRERTKVGFARRVEKIYEITGFDREKNYPTFNPVFEWNPKTDAMDSKNGSYIMKYVTQHTGMSEDQVRQELIDRTRVLEWMRKRKITDYKDVTNVIRIYYTAKDSLMTKIERDAR